jgi:hypothetical protein
MNTHIALLGDSIFDNSIYVEGPYSVSEHLRKLEPEWQVSLIAVDGHTTTEVPEQSSRTPKGVTHIALSIGGNDALNVISRLRTPCHDVIGALSVLAEIREEFTNNYRHALDAVMLHRLPVVLCTIYDQVPGLSPELQTALSSFNEVILREAAGRQMPAIDLRCICTFASDYSSISPIEPSEEGGLKIAQSISVAVHRINEGTSGCHLICPGH